MVDGSFGPGLIFPAVTGIGTAQNLDFGGKYGNQTTTREEIQARRYTNPTKDWTGDTGSESEYSELNFHHIGTNKARGQPLHFPESS